MRFLILAAVLAYASAAPSGALLAGSYAHGLLGHAAPLAVAHAAPLAVAHAAPVAVAHIAPALPTVNPGDINAAAIDAHVEAADHVRAAVDQANELHGRAINAAVDHSWRAVDAVKTAEAQLDGAAAGVSPALAKQLVGHSHTAPVVAHAAYAAPAVVAAPAAYTAPAVVAAPAAYAAPAVVAGHAAYAAPAVYAGHAAYAAPAIASSKTVVSQSLSQTHPAPLVHAAPLVAHAPVAYAAHLGYAHGLEHAW